MYCSSPEQRMLMGRKESNQTKQKVLQVYILHSTKSSQNDLSIMN